MSQICKHFRTKREILKSPSIPFSKPKNCVYNWCVHEKSKYRGKTLGGYVKCEGKKDKCIIPDGFEI